MEISDKLLTPAEKLAFRLRALFAERGYARYAMNKFEEYELYADNREFFGGDIVTFTGAGGKLMALRPDVTLSIVKNVIIPEGEKTARLYYHENVYRRAGLSREFRELKQCGVECIGDVGERETAEVLALAWESLKLFGGKCILDVSHVGFAAVLPEDVTLLYGKFEDVAAEFAAGSEAAGDMVRGMNRVIEMVKESCPDADIRFDYPLSQDMNYYNGIIFRGYAEGYPARVLVGGRYDKLMERFGKGGMGALGFSVYVDRVKR